MSWKTKYFGRNIDEVEADRVLKAIGFRRAREEMPNLEKWSSSYRGKVSAAVHGDYVVVDLYLTRDMFHHNDGTLGVDYEHELVGGRRSVKEITRTKKTSHYSGNIPLSDLHSNGELERILKPKRPGKGEAVAAAIYLFGAAFFVSPNLTGNAIGNFMTEQSNLAAAVLFVLSVAMILVVLRKR